MTTRNETYYEYCLRVGLDIEDEMEQMSKRIAELVQEIQELRDESTRIRYETYENTTS